MLKLEKIPKGELIEVIRRDEHLEKELLLKYINRKRFIAVSLKRKAGSDALKALDVCEELLIKCGKEEPSENYHKANEAYLIFVNQQKLYSEEVDKWDKEAKEVMEG